MARKIKWGVIGAGGIASRRTIPEWLAAGIDIAALDSVMDIDPAAARRVAGRFGIAHWCANESELLARDLDAVYIATPLNMHCAQAIQAAAAGKHILCEKPIAATIEEVNRMEEACRAAGVKFMLGFSMRNNIYHQKARELVQGGAIGRLVMARAQLTCWYPPIEGAWRQDGAISGGGALIDMGAHCIDLIEWICGSKIIEVCGFQDQLVQHYRTPIEDASTAVVRLENGAHGIIDNYFNLPDAAAQNALELHGTRGSIIGRGTIGQDPGGRLFSIVQPEETGYQADQIRNVPARRVEFNLEGKSLYARQIEIFSNCILEDREPPIGFADGRHSVAVIDAIYRAVRERRTIEVETPIS
ncbi:Gfo/Idh/MocA family oxidoreductase [bacterium]|nr:Gfo/Idh/MocA family oxidoreductase [bacterium]